MPRDPEECRAAAPGHTRVRRHRARGDGVRDRTQDSFYDRGSAFAWHDALGTVDRAVEDGAGIVDIGGVKAGYGADVSVDEERRRVVDLVLTVRGRHPALVISVDTWRSEIADDVLQAGADLINDTWAGADDQLRNVVAKHDAGIVCSHTGGLPPRTDPHRVRYDDVVAEVARGVGELARRAVAAGVRPDAIIVDPTHDFGNNTWHSLELTRRLDELVALDYPVLVSLSNKDFVGETLDLPVEARLPGTLAATAISAWHGARVFRAHQVLETRQVLDMISSIRGDRPPAVARRGLA